MALLRESGAVQVPSRKHPKWKLRNGFMFTTSSTPSDGRANMNALHQLRRMLGRSEDDKGEQFK
jgi:hypothetical protein